MTNKLSAAEASKRPKCPKCQRPMTKGVDTRGKPRWYCRRKGDYCYATVNPNPTAVRDQKGNTKKPTKQPIFRRTLGGVRTVLVTTAQNATPAHKDFIKTCETFCEARDAELVVIPTRYKNPTSKWTESQANDDTWDVDAAYLCNQRKRLNKNLIILGDVKIQATATDPLSSFDAMSHEESCIVGHTKLQLRTVPTSGGIPKILTTTGACTVRNYTDTKTGKLGDFHHTIGAALVEMQGKYFHLRQINASKETGEFIDLDQHFTASGVKKAERYEGLVLGDWHKDWALPAVEHATFGPGGMVELMRPKVIAWHDLDDNYSTNPHHEGDFMRRGGKELFNRSDARAELERACQYVLDVTPKDSLSIIVASNHNDFLSRWLKKNDPRDLDRKNRRLWCESVLAQDDSLELTQRGIEYVDAFIYWAKRYFAGHCNIRVLERGERFMQAGIKLDLHFDKGPNGARGSIKNLRRIGTKSMGGHGHGPGINEGAYQVGTATGELEYAIGSPSGWMNTHGSINALGKRCLHNIINGNWRRE